MLLLTQFVLVVKQLAVPGRTFIQVPFFSDVCACLCKCALTFCILFLIMHLFRCVERDVLCAYPIFDSPEYRMYSMLIASSELIYQHIRLLF